MEHEARPEESRHNGPLPNELQVQLSRFREGLAEMDQRTRTVVREHPIACVLGAVALGYLAGRLFTKRW